ncbi:MAG TPA: M20/M25/M40 family metallo-hydrolase [Thermoanaerobaculia bacterium]|jgi:acetylornithine deacetylase/succinyl-diaminopimelate desuccinylase-like protein|nr:M20/M25/M40 family metallo-hydrolase [Thermoanaerobaculia bacterium]
MIRGKSARIGCALLLVTAAIATAAEPSGVRDRVRAYRAAHEREILGELTGLLALPNVAGSTAAKMADIERNAAHLTSMLSRRGFAVQRLSAGEGTPPVLYGELLVPGAKRTVMFYAHYDGQPVDQKGWLSDPFKPLLRSGPIGPGIKEIDLKTAGPLDPEWRLYARSASDDKSPIVAILTALDALRAAGVAPSVNVKLFLEGEEEQGSPHLTEILRRNAPLLAADAWMLCDGPVHPTRRMQVYFGARGVSGLELTVYGPVRPLHSGHYGNWAPNPAVMLAHLVASLRDEEGRILIPGFYDDVRPLTVTEKQAVGVMPLVEDSLAEELGLGRTEGGRARLQDRLMEPALNVRGLRAAEVGEGAANAIPTEAQVSIDFRLVPDQTPQKVKAKVEAFLTGKGWHLVAEEPDKETLRAFPKVARIAWSLDYAAHRTDMNLPVSRAVVAAIERATGGPVVQVPMLGGSVPMALFTDILKAPMIGTPMVNHDNNQHGINENLRLQNLWDGIEVYAELMADLGGALGP